MANIAAAPAAEPILIIGGQGKTGRRIAERLTARGISVRPGSRSSACPFDWAAPETWRGTLEGISAAYVSYHPDLALPGAAEKLGALAELAREMGIGRLVLLSGRGEEGAQRAEQAVRSAVPGTTILRCSWFSQNFSESFLLDGVLAGEIALPAGDVPEPFLDAEDIADAAVAALTEESHAGRLYELTGPRALTFAEAADEIARAAGRPIAYRDVPLPDFVAALEAAGVPRDMCLLMQILFGEVLDGRNIPATDGVSRVLGRAPRDFADYARRTAATGVWRAGR